jgi:exopolysaccharide production protein ExoZ
LVLVFHAPLQLERLTLPAADTDWMLAGVDIFFVISGLIMWITTTAQPIGAVCFWRRRLVRIVPLYWLLTAAVAAWVLALILHRLIELPLRRAMRGHAVPDVAAQARAV